MEEEKAGTPNKFIVLRQEVMSNRTLTTAEKLVYARICAFDEYFEACEEASQVLGISPLTIRHAKQKLTRLGYIDELANTGRGKHYRAVYDLGRGAKKVTQSDKISHSDGLKKSLRVTKKVTIDKNIEKKENRIENNNVTDVTLLGDTAEHGNPNINKMFGLWEQQFGFKQKESAENRRACYNLIRRKDIGEEKLSKIIQLLNEAQADRFASKEVKSIVGFASLQTNLPHLMMWARRKYAQTQTQAGVEI